MVKGPVLKIQVFDCDGKGKKFRSDQIFLFTSKDGGQTGIFDSPAFVLQPTQYK
jgi:hypothetical protein